MTGNAEEWCWDWFSNDYTGAGANDPTGPSAGSGRVLRGGSWGRCAFYSRVSGRTAQDPALWDYGYGFRLARGRI